MVIPAHQVGSYVPDMSTSDQQVFEIRVQGRLGAHWAAWFDGMTLTDESDGVTVIHGPVVDQSALHGLLQKLRDVGLPLLSVTPADGGSPDHATPAPH